MNCIKTLGIITLIFFFAKFNADAQVIGPNAPCPTAEIQNTEKALFTPDEYAWDLFLEINKPGDGTTKCEDPDRDFGDDGPVVWETWRNVRNGAVDTIFKSGGADPGPWRSEDSPNLKTVQDLVSRPLKQAVLLTSMDLRKAEAASVFSDAAVGEGNEVRMNRDAYLFVRNEGLYSAAKQTELAQQGQLNLNFPKAAKEVKANWRRIRDADRPRYHWTIFKKEDGSREIWGLTALHITTKDLPNWLWATFEHVDNEIAGPIAGGGEDNEGWLTSSVDQFACKDAPYDCNLAPKNIGLEGTKWENYRLRGTQIDFVDTIGRPTILSNSQIERGFQNSSCISCHALAARKADGQINGFAIERGVPDPNDFLDQRTGDQEFMQHDFVFSLSIRAE